MESAWIECRSCETLVSELKEYSVKSCRICDALDCDECLNEAGYCMPCSEKSDYSKEDAIPV
jgi:multimeric flavodoxin WrbA